MEHEIGQSDAAPQYVQRTNLSMRLPRWAHKRMKGEARLAGKTVADHYAAVLERFLDEEADGFRKYLLTGPTSSPSVTLALVQPVVGRVRELADERDMVISDIVYTAILIHMGEAHIARAA
ncbi:hypothetical protein LRS10_23590 [Phenylobacterium sp. J426]|uniref:hypothetical protein n=1 Tax=Phenylobacterium sp. J426 TaxID=2898439 RepID=UPI002151CD50|nr:hypothetical protein [Phenylobacterium sp. J426]MCR5876875.1 hypothetical protein [Phenylobacterium sp. J426]